MSDGLNPNVCGRLKKYLRGVEESLGVFLLGPHYRGICPVSNKAFSTLDTYISTPSKLTHEARCSDCGEKISSFF